jgi:hypothetical protein
MCAPLYHVVSDPSYKGRKHSPNPVQMASDMASQSSQSSQSRDLVVSKRLTWTFEMQETLVLGLQEQGRLGKRADNSFKSEAFAVVLPQVQAISPSNNPPVTKERAKAKLSDLRKQFQVWWTLRNQSGFGWNEETGIIEAPDSVWEAYIEVSI